jgi:hypothetical protein
MKTIRISDPEDVTFPLDKETYFDPAVYYHGTSTAFSSLVESDGFKRNASVYDKADLAELYKAYDSPYFKAIIAAGGEMKMQKEDLDFVLGSGGFDMKDEPLSFSGSYWTARNYSTNRGGEAIDHAVRMSRWISELPDCPHQGIAEKIQEKYGPIFDNHAPCVYALRLPDEEVKKARDDMYVMFEENGVPGKTHDSNHFVFNDIPKESIVARIDLSKEIKRWKASTTFKGSSYRLPWDQQNT